MKEYSKYSRTQLIDIINQLNKEKIEYQKLLNKENKQGNDFLTHNSQYNSDNKNENEKTLRSIIDILPLAVGIVVNEAKIEYLNRKFTQLLGYSTTDVPTMDIWWAIVYPDTDYRKNVQNQWMLAVEKAHKDNVAIETQEWIVTAKNGHKLICEFSMVPLGNRSIIVVNDITEERQKLENLRKAIVKAETNEKNLKIIIKNSPLPMVITLDNKYVTFVNKKFTQLFGYVKEDIPDAETYFSKAYPDEEYRNMVLTNWMGAIEIAIKTKTDIESQEYILTTKSGEKRNVEFRTVVLENKMIVVANDVTVIRQYHDEILAAKEKAEESDRLKSAFLANMSHEIRTPMNGILGFSDLLKSQDLEYNTQRRYLELIEKSGQRMLSTIGDLIEISKIESGQMELYLHSCNINDIMEDLYDFFSLGFSDKSINFSYKNGLDDNKSIVQIDEGKLNGVLTNLIKNSLKFIKEGAVSFGYVQKGSFLEFYVKDTGIGIALENHDKIFKRFSQEELNISSPYEGSGLGLSISKAYVEFMGGNIWVDSEKGKGSIFYFTIPYNK